MVIDEWQNRSLLLLGEENLKKLQQAKILVAGLGGVGAYAAEHLCRSGIGCLCIADADRIEISNINRQLPALHSTIGMLKTDLLKKRFLDINPRLDIKTFPYYIIDEVADKIINSNDFDYVVDAIDTLSPKIHLIRKTLEKNIPLVSSAGSGGRVDATKVEVADISESHHDRLAFVLRKKLRKYNIHNGFKIVFSPEQAVSEATVPAFGEKNKKSRTGTISYLPAVFGCIMASVVVNDIISKE